MSGPSTGQRIRLTGAMRGEEEHDPLPVGATGVVEREANAAGQVWVRWDPPHSRRRLMLLLTDPYEVVPASPEFEFVKVHAIAAYSDKQLERLLVTPGLAAVGDFAGLVLAARAGIPAAEAKLAEVLDAHA